MPPGATHAAAIATPWRFELTGHPNGDALLRVVTRHGGHQEAFYAVRHLGPVTDWVAAVRAAIAAG